MLQVSFDGGLAVTGTVIGLPNPAEFRTGTFNPQTGTLRLEANQTGNSNVSIVFDGKVVEETATGQRVD
jgi:hypothetical protein